ncbi:MAG TPA: hypothetical protein EYN54_11935 [Methylococcaceae bacterium]|nr:hypothetical protein [Methylococcaceae bacterium]
MKTVMDAVNHFGCRFPSLRYTTDNWYEDGCDLFYREQTICSAIEFNDLVSQLETNFGECDQCYSDYLAGVKVDGILESLTKPVFTKDMYDNDELPPVGSEVEFNTTFFTTVTSNKGTCEIIAYFGGKVWLNVIDIDFVINLNVIEFKPIDTRTDKEKAIDDILNGGYSAGTTRELLSIAYVKWVGE